MHWRSEPGLHTINRGGGGAAIVTNNGCPPPPLTFIVYNPARRTSVNLWVFCECVRVYDIFSSSFYVRAFI